MKDFEPDYTSTVSISVTETSGNAEIRSGTYSILLTNIGEKVCYITVGKESTLTATTAGLPLLAGFPMFVSKASDDDYVAAICASGETTTLKITTGNRK